MRSISLYLIAATRGDLESTLAAIARQEGENCWTLPSFLEEHAIYLSISSDPSDIGGDELASLVQFFGKCPGIRLLADISGRVAGESEVRRLTEHVLSTLHGVAQDDYTCHCWTLQEITNGTLVDGHPFFDYLGWHEAPSRG